jgi:matrix metalloproteinase-19 (RASI)
MYDKWGKTDLTYHMLDRDTKHMKAREWDDVWAKSFRCWSDVCPVTFKKISSGLEGWQDADIVIDVNRTAPGFGSKGHILALAEIPNGQNWDAQLWTQFDRSEDWVVERDDSNDSILQGVAVHEIGHLLGLGHSEYVSSIMYPYHVSDLIIAPQEYDIRAIQTLYGEK